MVVKQCPKCGRVNSAGARFCSGCRMPLAATPTPLRVGQSFHQGRYVIQRQLGKGGMGATYLAVDTRAFNRRCVIKVMLPYFDPNDPNEFQAALKRFEQEAKALAELGTHPNIPNLLDWFEEGGQFFLVMEFIEGENLEEKLQREGPQPIERVVEWGIELCKILEFIAQKGYVHHDIKPANIILHAGAGEPVLVDFGTVKTGQLAVKASFGTEGYAPPEQMNPPHRTEHRSDVFALAASLYHLLTGDHPAQNLWRFPQLSKMPQPLHDALRAALDLDVNKRPTASELRKQLEECLHTLPTQNPYLPRIQQILSDLAKIPPSPHDPTIQKIEAELAKLSQFVAPRPNLCPGCRQAQLVQVTGNPDGKCPLCRQGQLLSWDLTKCPVCRDGRLVQWQLGKDQLFCPVCHIAVLQGERYDRSTMRCALIFIPSIALSIAVVCFYGWEVLLGLVCYGFWILGLIFSLLYQWLENFLPDLYQWICSHCHAEFRGDTESVATLLRFSQDPYGVGKTYQGQTRTIAEWKSLSKRSDRGLRCEKCAAQLDAHGTQYMLYVSQHTSHILRSTPYYSTSQQYHGKTLPSHAWAKLAQGLPPTEGNRSCSHCNAEFDYDLIRQTLTLLSCKGSTPIWALRWKGQPIPIRQWYLATAGKRSLQPGYFCPSCKTEFDEQQSGQFKLIWTAQPKLAPFVNQIYSLSDWHRLAAGLPTSDQEQKLRNELLRLQTLKQQEPAQKRRAQLNAELTNLLKRSFIKGFLGTLRLLNKRITLQVTERLFWEGKAQKWDTRGSSWWIDASGTLLVTNERIIFDSGSTRLWERPLTKLLSIETQRLKSGSTVIIIEVEGRQNPIAFEVDDLCVTVTLNNQSFTLILTMRDLVDLLRVLKGTP